VYGFSKAARFEDGFGGEDVALPAAILKDREEPVVLARDADELPRLGEVKGEGLIYDDVFACAQRGSGEREVAVVRAGDDDQVHIGVRRRFNGWADGDTREVREHLFRLAGADDSELKPRNGADEGSVKCLADVAVADEADANRGGRRIGHGRFFRVEDAARESKPKKRMTTRRGRAMLEESCSRPSDPMHIEARPPVFCCAL